MTDTVASESHTVRRNAGLRGRRGIVVVVAILALAALVAVAGYLRHSDSKTPAVPYADPSSAGRLTICSNGAAITSGSTTAPLGSLVVSDLAAAPALAGPGRTAALFAYQPRAGVGPEEWSGLQLNADSAYPDVAHPSTKVTTASTTLAQFLTAYPANDNGWVQLRLVLGAPGAAQNSTTYATGDLHVHGSTWTLSDPGSAGCS